jgi:hypothetical protein
MSETERRERYVAYYRMPSIGDTPNGDTLARQRRHLAAFLDHPDRELVGEFTEVMTAVPRTELTSTAQQTAARDKIEILLIGETVSPSSTQPEIETNSEIVPYLRLGRGRHTIPPPMSSRPAGGTPAGNRAKADQFAAAILPIIEQIRESGATSLTDIAEGLNARNIRTARGKRWYPTTVKNILDRRQ